MTLSARALRPDIVIIARARDESSTAKLMRAGADRTVNPQLMEGRRLGAFTLQPHVAEFLDVVMHDESLDSTRTVRGAPGSPQVGTTLGQMAAHLPTGALLLAPRRPGRPFEANPDPDIPLEEGRASSRSAPPTS